MAEMLEDPLREVLAVVDDSGVPMTTPEIADRLDLGRRTVYNRLDRLTETDRLATKKVGANARVWWRPQTGDGQAAGTREALEAVCAAAAVSLDSQGQVRTWDAGAKRLTGYDAGDAVGTHISEFCAGDMAETAILPTGQADERRVTETQWRRADGSTFRAAVSVTDAPEEGAGEYVAVFQARTEGTECRVDADRAERLVESVDDGIYVLDENSQFVAVNEAFCALTGYDRETLRGADVSLVAPEAPAPGDEKLVAEFQPETDPVATVEERLQTSDGGTVPVETRVSPLGSEAEMRVAVVRETNERTELRDRVQQQEIVSELGQRALEEDDLCPLLADATELVAETLGTDYCKVLDLDESASSLRLREGVGWKEGIVGEATVSAVEDDSQAAYTLRSKHPVVVRDLTEESRFSGPDLLRNHDVRSGISTIIGSFEDPWGILGTHDTEAREFADRDVVFVQSVANILASAIHRHRHEERLVRQREEIAALNNLNEAVRGITSAVLDQSTREEIERTVCEHLAESESYQFAWVGEVDSMSQQVSLRTEAGVEGYLDDVDISVDPDDARSQGPTGKALVSGEVQTTQNAPADSDYEPWQDVATEYGFRSSAAIPIIHEDTTYGVLNVYSGRPEAFEGRERTVIGHLGEIVGHAIAAVERKQALISDEVVELEFRIESVFEPLGIETRATDPIRFEHTVALGDDEFLLFGRTTPAAIDTVEALADAVPYYRMASVAEDGDQARFQLRVTEPPVLSVIASLGGSVEEAVVEDGDYRLRVQLSPDADVRQVTEAVRETFRTVTLLKRHQRPRQAGPRGNTVTGSVTDELTDRQQTALETAYYAGFFDWPRDASGEDVAESLGIAPPTFHQHLRKAERKVFERLL